MGSVLYDQEIHAVRVTDAARQAGKPSLEFVAEAVSFLHKDGIVILENVIDVAHIDHLNSILSPEALEIANDPDHHFNFGKHTRNMDQAPPPTRDLMYKDVWANSFACAVLSAVLGPKPVIHYANGNTALQAAPDGRQPVHSDCEFEHPVYFPFACVVNINLVDTGPENGATEVWPGSHHVSTPDCHMVLPDSSERILHVNPEYVEERRRHSPPLQPCTRRGSIVIRDLRLWHAGMPNLTPTPRIMLAFVAQPAWFQGRSKIKLPLSVKDLVESWSDELHFSVEWVDGEVDHKKLSSANVDFGSCSRAFRFLSRCEIQEQPPPSLADLFWSPIKLRSIVAILAFRLGIFLDRRYTFVVVLLINLGLPITPAASHDQIEQVVTSLHQSIHTQFLIRHIRQILRLASVLGGDLKIPIMSDAMEIEQVHLYPQRRRQTAENNRTDTSPYFTLSKTREAERTELSSDGQQQPRQMLLSLSGGRLTTKKPLVNPISRNAEERRQLAAVARETLILLPGLLATRPDITNDSYLCRKETLDPTRCPGHAPTKVRVIDSDTIDAALGLPLLKSHQPVAILNMANAETPGGGWRGGAKAQEEAICYRTSLSKTLHQKHYPIPDDAALYSPTVLVIRESMSDDNELLDFRNPSQLDTISVISCAAVEKPRLRQDGQRPPTYYYQDDIDLMMEKMRVVLRTAIRNKHRQIVLGAFGCGVFGNPNHIVADMWLQVLTEPEFQGGYWRDVIFAVLGGKQNTNFAVFHHTLDGKSV